MFECLILGDSIAVGTKMYRPECVSYSKGGWNTWQWNRGYLRNDLNARTVIISLGTNDHPGVKTRAELLKMRNKVKAEKVYWIMPAIKPNIQEIVREIAKQYGDAIINIPSLSRDGIHPSGAGYKSIASQAK